MKTRRIFTRNFKLSVLRELESGKNVAQLSRENNLHPSLIARWKKEHQNDPKNAFQGNGNTYKDSARIAELEKLIGRLYAENSLLKKALTNLELHLQEQRKKNSRR